MSPLFKCFVSEHVWERQLVSHGMEYDRYDYTCERCGKQERYVTDYGGWAPEKRPSLREALGLTKGD